MKKGLLMIAIVFCITLIGGISLAFAQGGPLPIPGQGAPVNNGAPIGGIAILAVAGGGYALKKLYDKRVD